MTIKQVRGWSDGCGGSSTYCDGDIHVKVDRDNCHHGIDYDDPNDIEHRVTVSACNESDHHNDGCYECRRGNESNCFVRNRDDGPAWEYKWTEEQLDMIDRFNEKPDAPIVRELAWSSAEKPYPYMRRVGSDRWL